MQNIVSFILESTKHFDGFVLLKTDGDLLHSYNTDKLAEAIADARKYGKNNSYGDYHVLVTYNSKYGDIENDEDCIYHWGDEENPWGYKVVSKYGQPLFFSKSKKSCNDFLDGYNKNINSKEMILPIAKETADYLKSKHITYGN